MQLIINKKNFLIYINYFLSFIGSISFLIIANFLELKNLEKYILVLSISTLFASTIYSSSIKAKLENNIININFTKNTIKTLIIIFLLICIYLLFKENYFLIFFFTITIVYEICFNLFAITFIKRNNSLGHSLFLLFTSIFKNFILLLALFFSDLLKIMLFFYIFYSIFFIINFKKLNIIFKQNKKSFHIFDFFYILTGTLIYQIDKIFGESFLNRNDYITYFLIFKFASAFQIIGNLLTQPIRNKMISIEKISSDILSQLRKIISYIIIFLLFTNLFFIIFNNFIFFNEYIFEINVKNILVFNFLSLSIITHIYNGFYIDSLFINNNGKLLLKVNIFIISLIIIFLTFFKSLIIWSSVIFLAQILLLIFAIRNYNKYVR